MKQLVQQLRSGEMQVLETPAPLGEAGNVLVQVHFSLISAGTEGGTVRTARKGLLGKAMERPQQVKQVLDVLRQQGPVQAYRAVMKKLDAYSPLGYSCAGVVLAAGAGVAGFAAGDRVACAGGGYANHAEIVAVPANLCVKLPPDADLRRAAYNTLGAIALQGIRQADVRLGESCAVIGLGLIGQLTGLMLQAAGVRVAGVDVDPAAVAAAAAHSADLAVVRDTAGLEGQIMDFSGGMGVDAVIITAGTDSLDPVNFAGAVCRKKGRVVVVGAVPTGFDRDPHYYRKELELRMSCSYGPGRYDPRYEEQGVDYPPAYVRWTEQRNMAAFQELVHYGKIDLDYLTTHEFPLDEAPAAYDLILERREPVLGVVIRYDTGHTPDRAPIPVAPPPAAGRVGIAFVGAGNYAQGNLLPNLPDDPAVARHGVFDASGPVARRVAERFGFSFCAGEIREVLERPEINTVCIATRHDSHADYVLQALRAGKHVFVEKPLALNDAELESIEAFLIDPASRGTGDGRRETGDGNQESENANHQRSTLNPQLSTLNSPTSLEPRASSPLPLLMVGFNRRFSPLARQLKESLRPGPMAMLYRVNAGAIPADHWIQDPAVGGGRIVGEACHFIDFLTFLCGALPVRVHAAALPDPAGHGDTLHVNLEFADGSVGTVAYLANGARSLAKEYVEVHQHGTTAVLGDFKWLELHGGRAVRRTKRLAQDKGQRAMLAAFLEAVKDGRPSPISLAELLAVTRATFRALDSARARAALAVGPPPPAPEPAEE
jgi:polar amino acid transport system substrate-binding protein